MIDTLLWDVDGTLLDFTASERVSLLQCAAMQGVALTEHHIRAYQTINHDYWRRFEAGEITKEQLYPGRFADWFARIGLTGADPVRMNADYQACLGKNPVLRSDTLPVLAGLRGTHRQYVVTNGSVVAQEGKLKASGIGALMDGIFISEQLGVPKPDRAFFDLVAGRIAGYDPERTAIIGDSLSSDMAGGNNAGIRCILFDPEERPLPDGVRIDARVTALSQVPDVLRML